MFSMKLAKFFGGALVASLAAMADVPQGGSVLASNTGLSANDSTIGSVAGFGSSASSLGFAPHPTALSTYGNDYNVIRMMNNPFTVGDLFYNGTLKIENDAKFNFQHGGIWPEGLTVMGDLIHANEKVTVTFNSLVPASESAVARDYSQLNYIYVDGKIMMGRSQFKMGTDHVNPINLYAGSIYADTDGYDSFENWSGDIYMHAPNGVSKFMVGKSGQSIVQFISNNIRRPNVPGNYLGGNIFCNNKELTIVGCGSDSNVSIGGDIIMSNPLGHLIIDLSANYQSLVIGGSVVCAGKLTIKIRNMHNFKAVGGIYVDPSKVTFDIENNNGKINDVDYDGCGEAFVRVNFAKGFTMQHKTTYGGVDNTISHGDPETAAFGTFTNTDTYSYIQSLGVEASGTTNYDDTFKRIRTNARARGYPKNVAEDGSWTSLYLADLATKIGNGYENYDYSLYPYCCRWDEIFEKYVRWDIHQTPDGFGYDNAMKESEAAGHTYGNYQPLTGGDTFKACTPIVSNAALVPVRVYGARNLQAGVNYFNSKSHFSPYPDRYGFPSTAYKEVTIGTHKGDGSYDMPKKCFFVVEDSCVIDLADINTNSDENKKRFDIFINPEGKASPINVIFQGQAGGAEMVNIVINNTVKYDVSGGSFDYTNASYDKTYTKLKADPGREQVRIFFEKGSETVGGDKFNIYCTGAYGQFSEGAIHAIGSPYYPGTLEYTGRYGDVDSVTPIGSDAYAHELIPNVRVYAEDGATLKCVNQFFVNAEVLMPEGTIWTGTNSRQCKLYFKEYPYSEEIYVESKYLFVLGSYCARTLRVNDAQGTAVYLGDKLRGAPPPVSHITVEASGCDAVYDGEGHGIEVEVHDPASGATVTYALAEGGPYSSGPILFTNACVTSVWCRVSADNYEDFVKKVMVTVSPRDIANASVGPIGRQQFTGAAVKPVPVVTDGEPSIITEGDYDVSWRDNDGPGTATLVLTGKNNYTGTKEVKFDIGTAELSADISWKYLKATGTYFAHLEVACTNSLASGVGGLKFLFADRVGEDGSTLAALWDTPRRAANTNVFNYGGAMYRCVSLDASRIVAEKDPVVFGVVDPDASTVPVGERAIEMYVQKRVVPEAGNAGAAKVGDFVGYVYWESGGEPKAVPVVAGARGRTVGALGRTTAGAALPSAARLNAALAVGAAPDDGAEPYCFISEYRIDGATMRGRVEVGMERRDAAGGLVAAKAGSLGENAKVVLLGGDAPEGPMTRLCEVAVAADGSFSLPVPEEGAKFFRLSIEIDEVLK